MKLNNIVCFFLIFFYVFRKAKPAEVVNFFNNVDSVWDNLVKRNGCYKMARLCKYVVEAGASDKV